MVGNEQIDVLHVKRGKGILRGRMVYVYVMHAKDSDATLWLQEDDLCIYSLMFVIFYTKIN
jgi:hypothetical protein